jgi:hypothetical protein
VVELVRGQSPYCTISIAAGGNRPAAFLKNRGEQLRKGSPSDLCSASISLARLCGKIGEGTPRGFVSWGFNSPRGVPSLARKEVKVFRWFAARGPLFGFSRQSQLLSRTGAGQLHNPNTSSSFQDPGSQSARLPSLRPDRQDTSPHAHGSSTTRACGNHPRFAPLMSLLPLLLGDAMRIRGSTFSPKPLSPSQPMCYKNPGVELATTRSNVSDSAISESISSG